jgi:contact-dependent growth inhibition (CDI) system restriction endonuclease-like protein
VLQLLARPRSAGVPVVRSRIDSARAAWLRADLSGAANRRLLALRTPYSWGLPEFTDELQAQQALHQESQVNERLRRRNLSVERVDVGMEVAQLAETPDGIALGGGALMTVTKQNARWIVFKTPAASGTSEDSAQGDDPGLRTSAASGPQTIHGIDLAAAVIAFILRHRPGRRDNVVTFPSLAAQMRPPGKPASALAPVAFKPPAKLTAPPLPAKAQKPPSPPADWPKLTPEEIERSERGHGQHWWPIQPIGETDWIWLTSLERRGRAARDGLIVFYHEVATLGRMAKEMGDPETADIEPLYAQRDNVQRAYDNYIKTLIEVESLWTKYLQGTHVFIGIHVIALKNKIDLALPTSVEGFHSTLDGQLKVEIRQSSEALRAAQGKVEGAYTTALWTDRVITVILLANVIRGILAGVMVTFEAGIAKGLAPAAARRAAIAVGISHLVIATGSATAINYVVPKILIGAGLDAADVRAGMAIFAALLTFADAVASATTRPRGKTGVVNEKDLPFELPPPEPPDRGVWDLGPATRGNIIHERLGNNTPPGFPTIDKIDAEGIVTSIKSLDLGAKSYQNPATITRVVQGYIDKVADFTGDRWANFEITPSQIKGRALVLAVPPGKTAPQQEALNALIEYGLSKGVNVHIEEIQK